MRRIIAALVIMAALPSLLLAESITLSGSVTGPQDQPVEKAAVQFYRITMDALSGAVRYQVVPFGQVETAADGRFTYSAEEPPQTDPAFYTCIASKEGLSLGWKTLMEPGQLLDIKLTEPQKLIGFVANPDGTAVPDAAVSLIFVTAGGGFDSSDFTLGLDPIKELQATTCSDGRFEFSRLPEGTTAEFLVKKEGKAPLITFSAHIDPSSGLTYSVNQPDIMLTMQKPCTISGVVMTKADQTPVEGISVIASQDDIPMTLFDIEPAVSAADGSFTISNIAPGRYNLKVVDCPDWIAQPVPLEVKGSVGARIELQKGGTLEVRVIDDATGRPVEKANVQVALQNGQNAEIFLSDADGIARKQLLAGNYEVRAFASGYQSMRNSAVAVIESDTTATIELRLAGPTRLTGLVKTPDGKPAADVTFQMVPSHVMTGQARTDKDGRFALSWDPGRMSWGDNPFLLVATDRKNKLARSVEIDSETKEVDITLQKGCTVQGKVFNEQNEPMKGARANLTIWGGSYGTSFGENVKTDETGQYVFEGLPPDQRFSINISGVTGFGSDSTDRFYTQSDASEALTLENTVLRVADQTLSGFAVDVEGQPIEGAVISLNGSGQPSASTKSAKDGSFKFDRVCSGDAHIHANFHQSSDYIYGNLRTEGGASDVYIVLTGRGGYSGFTPKKPVSLVGKPLPSLTDYGLTVPDDARPVLLFVWDMQQRPSRHFVKELAAQKQLFESKGVTVVLLNAAKVEKETLDAWLAENNVTFPSGIISIDPDNTAFSLGVQSMPWMILTGADRTVKAEGFAMDELADKLNSL